ncbi:hypothetical protein FSP39_009857 [Pinctada imbricata]|uniref:Ribonuclease P protein subunit p29 n=1 Tax=Pinctada imbricata TaxID=66713 RepID=A0AA88XK88_PINIB|nr:hypothetical protein FSP39_009857 [Pinctada imbricata]
MYEGLPNFAYEHASVLGLTSSLHVKDDFVSTFLQKSLPATRLEKGEDGDIQHKFQMLDSIKKKSVVRDTEKRGIKKKAKKLTAKEKRKLKLFEIEKEDQKYEDYLPMHELWLAYMRKTMGLDKRDDINVQESGMKLLKGDLHGSNLLVYKSRCPSYIGTAGICLKETKNMFTLITKENKVKCIPKLHSVFMVQIDDHVFTIAGDNFRVAAAKRSTHKFKSKGGQLTV